MVKVGPIDAEFLVNGKVVAEYPDDFFDQEPAASQASKYVEGVSGATFAVRCTLDKKYKFSPGVDQLHFAPYIDGVLIVGDLLTRVNFKKGWNEVTIEEDVEIVEGVNKVRKLQFAEIQTQGKYPARANGSTLMS